MQAMSVTKRLGMATLTRLLCLREEPGFVDACAVILQRVFNAIAKMDRHKEVKPDPEVCEGTEAFLCSFEESEVNDSFLITFVSNCSEQDRNCEANFGIGRNAYGR